MNYVTSAGCALWPGSPEEHSYLKENSFSFNTVEVQVIDVILGGIIAATSGTDPPSHEILGGK